MIPTQNSRLETDLATVRKARIFFSHHSVGENVLQGIQKVVADSGAAQLKIATLEEAATTSGAALLHGSGGENKDPASKIRFFESTILGNRDLRPDVAFMKFCFVDFSPSTDVDGLFAQYQRTILKLKRERPDIRFAHVTAPLTRQQNDLKSTLRRALGLQVWGDASNAKRYAFNQKLVQAFPSDPVFDLAGAESIGPDGTPVSFAFEGKRLPSMVAGYTDDDGHLNALGQRVAGAAAIRFLGAATRPPQEAIASTPPSRIP